jgi:hypothetical protein
MYTIAYIKRDDRDALGPVAWALKDVDLAAAAAGELPLLGALSRQWHAAVDAGRGREDVSAARLAAGRRS